MKKRLIGSLITGVIIFSLVGCGSDEGKATGSKGENKVETGEIKAEGDDEKEKDKESLSEEEVNAEFERIKPELISYFKENGIKYQECSDIWIDFDQTVGDVTISGKIKKNKGIYIRMNLYFDEEKAKKGEVDINLDKTMAPKICEIVTGIEGKSYEKYYKEINEIVKNKHSENPDSFIAQEFSFKEDLGNYREGINMGVNSLDGGMDVVIKSK